MIFKLAFWLLLSKSNRNSSVGQGAVLKKDLLAKALQNAKDGCSAASSFEPTNDTLVVCPRGKFLGAYLLAPSRGVTKTE